jgi:hypothetical protein
MKRKIVKPLIAVIAMLCALLLSGCESDGPQAVYGPPPSEFTK